MSRQKSKPASVYSTTKKKKAEPTEAGPADLSYISPDLRALAVPIDTLVLDPHNSNKHPDKSIEGLQGTLAAYGQRKPVVLNTRTGFIEAGNGLLEAARSLGWTHLAVSREDDDKDTAQGYALVDNAVSRLSYLDKDKLKVQLKDVNTKNDARLDSMLADLAKEKNLFPTDDKKDVNFQTKIPALEVIVTCDNAEEQDELVETLEKEGWTCRRSGG